MVPWGEQHEYDSLLMHWTITTGTADEGNPCKQRHEAGPCLPATCYSQSRPPKWLSETRTMGRVISGVGMAAEGCRL